jgi:hypothetical protein
VRGRSTIAIVVGPSELFMWDGASCVEFAAAGGVPELGQISRTFWGRRAVIGVSPSLAQVRRVGGIAADLAYDDARRLVEQNMEDAFIGICGSLTLMQVARVNEDLWAWAVPTKWHREFTAAFREAGIRVIAMLPLSRVWEPPGHASGTFVTCVDSASAAVVRVANGKIEHEWRTRLDALSKEWAADGAIRLGDAVSEVEALAEMEPLSVPSSMSRASTRRRRAVAVPISIGITALALSFVAPHTLRQRHLDELRAERQHLEEAARTPASNVQQASLRRAMADLRMREEHATAPFLPVLWALARASTSELRVLSLNVDTVRVTVVATASSSSAVVDTLHSADLFDTVYVAGEITRVSEDIGSTERSPNKPTGVDGDAPEHLKHHERVTIVGTLRSGRRPSTPAPLRRLAAVSGAVTWPKRP